MCWLERIATRLAAGAGAMVHCREPGSFACNSGSLPATGGCSHYGSPGKKLAQRRTLPAAAAGPLVLLVHRTPAGDSPARPGVVAASAGRASLGCVASFSRVATMDCAAAGGRQWLRPEPRAYPFAPGSLCSHGLAHYFSCFRNAWSPPPMAGPAHTVEQNCPLICRPRRRTVAGWALPVGGNDGYA